MAGDRLELSATLTQAHLSSRIRQDIDTVLERYDSHRKVAVKRLRELLDARPDALTLSIRPQNLKAIIDHQLQIYESRLTEEGIGLVKSLKPADRDVKIDGSTFAYVIRILLNNAIAAIRLRGVRPGRIGVFAKVEDGLLFVRVSDNGCGIKAGMQHQIFDAFFTTKVDGNGIGLYWARTILERQGATIELDRSLEGDGSVFRVTMPIEE
jgi:signal transduction histidine kinase